MTLTYTESKRLAEIRSKLVQFEAQGVDTGTWEAAFFLNIIEKLRRNNDTSK